MSEQAAAPAESGALSIDSAVGLLAPRDEAPAPEPVEAVEPEQDDEHPAAPTAEEAEAQPSEAEPEAEEVETVEPEAPAIDPPHSWDAEAKAEFAQLPRKAQEIILTREAQRDKAVFEAQERAAAATKRAEAEASTLGQYKAHLDQLLPRAQQVFASKWDGIDWPAWAQQDPIAAFQGQESYKAELANLQQLQQAQQQAQQTQYAQFMQAEAQKLPQLAPDLVHPEHGAANKAKLRDYLASNGVTDALVSQADATQLAIAWKAMRFDELQAEAKRKLTPTSTPVPARPTPRPGAAQPASSKTRDIETLTRRLGQTGKVDDAVALLEARSRATSKG